MLTLEARHLGDWWKSIDRTLMFVVLALISVGLILSLASSPAATVRENISDPFFFLYRQSAFALLSLFVLIGVSSLDPRGIRRLAALTLLSSFALIFATLFIGHEAGGASRWIRLPGFSIQPSEFLKPSLIVIAAWLFAESRAGAPIPGRVIAFGLYLTSVVLLMQQPDFGQSILITLVFGGVFFVAGLNIRWMAGLIATAGAGIAAAWAFLPYVAERVERFLDPSSGERFQTETAIAAISRGGIMGVGPGEGTIKRSLPDSHTDFIFSVAAEEFGLLASLSIIGLFSILVARAWMNALKLTDHFAQLAVCGLALQFALQAFINIGVNLDLIPPKGMTLPFISYGGSSMLALALGAGMMLALTRRRPGAYLRA